ncbi:MAG: hypothetical protein JW973_06705 [Bacteroidales bacterium]|nr:hypothetical protein [Bacteroidales bacterium]
MKRFFLFSAVSGLLLFILLGCEEILDKIGVTINSDYTYIDFTVNPDKAGTYSETFVIIESDLDSIIEAEGQNIGELNSVKIKDASVRVVDEEGNLDPFESFVLTLEAPGKAAIKVAEVTAVPTGITEIPLIQEETDLSDYLKSDQYTVKVKAVLDQDLETHRNMQAKVRYEIKVGL